MSATKSALVVINAQRGFFDGAPRPYEADEVLDRINALTTRARAHQMPVVFVHHERSSGFLEYGSESWQLEPHLIVDASDFTLRKTTLDPFLRTDISSLLAELGIEQIVICGYGTEFCVDTTTTRAAALGLPVVLVADAHTTHDKSHATGAQIRKHHNTTLLNIGSFGATH